MCPIIISKVFTLICIALVRFKHKKHIYKNILILREHMMKADTELGRIDRPPSLKHSSDDHPRDNAANDNLVGVLLIYNHNVYYEM